MPLRPVLIALGGVLGVLVRWGTIELGDSHRSLTILGLNILGSTLMGVLAGRDRVRGPIWSFGAIGFCGGLTTFSSFAVEVATRINDGQYTGAVGLLVLTVGFAALAAGIGYRLGSRSVSSAMASAAPANSENRRARP